MPIAQANGISLYYEIAGPDNAETGHPALNMYLTTFRAHDFAKGAAIAIVLFVVAATEGWKPQSEEHLRVLELLGHRHGLIALTKVGLVDDELRELARGRVEGLAPGQTLRANRRLSNWNCFFGFHTSGVCG